MASISAATGPRLTVDLSAIGANYELVRKYAAGADVAAVVKADSYGLGAAQIAPMLAARGCRKFFVATSQEGSALLPQFTAQSGIKIFVLGGITDIPGLTSVINSRRDLETLRARAHASGAAQAAALHIDTGMNRLGLPLDEALALLEDPRAFDGITLKLLISHLACADVPEAPHNAAQLERFRKIHLRLPNIPCSLANSAGALLGPDYRFDVVRPGIALYGGNPMADSPNLFLPTVTLEAPLLQVRFIGKGDNIGYAASYRAAKKTRIATLALGYADGYLRAASNRGSVTIGGHIAQIVGRVSMDLITVDVTALPDEAVVPGAMAELIGKTHTIDTVAKDARTISYEVLTRLGGRIERHYLPDVADHQRGALTLGD